MNPPLILASSSPRRRELLASMRLSFRCEAVDVDEAVTGKPADIVITLAERKARQAAQAHLGALVLGADTLVYAGGKVFGKPCDEVDAFRMLSALVGGWHQVYTGLCLLDTRNDGIQQDYEVTEVHFQPLTDDEINAYIRTGEPFDKAGAYGIQGIAGMYIDCVRGNHANVIGLPTANVRRMLLNAGYALL